MLFSCPYCDGRHWTRRPCLRAFAPSDSPRNPLNPDNPIYADDASKADAPPAIPEGFTPWPGGHCPPDARGKPTHVFRRDGVCSANHCAPKLGEAWVWSHIGEPSDIVGYRVESKPKPAAVASNAWA